jgi:hypothetical protein
VRQEQGGKTAQFAAELRALYEAAGRPTYTAVCHQAKAQRPPVRVGTSTLSAWLKGDNVPAEPRAVVFLTGYLANLAKRRDRSFETRPSGWWNDLYKAAVEEKRAGRGRGGRPTSVASASGREDLATLIEAGPARKIAADVTDFTTLIYEHTEEFVGRRRFSERLWAALDDDAFGSGYLFVHGEPGIGKTALLAQLIRERNLIHHFNSVLVGITSREHFLRNVCAQLILCYELPDERLPG